MSELTFERLRRAVGGEAVALRSRMVLQPAGGQGDKVFPPTYAVARNAEQRNAQQRDAQHRYAVEERHHDDGKVSVTVLLDSVASQANRAELALLEGWELGELRFPVPYVDFRQEGEIGDLGRLTVLEAPHRLADAIFRDSLLDGTLFRLSDSWTGGNRCAASERDCSVPVVPDGSPVRYVGLHGAQGRARFQVPAGVRVGDRWCGCPDRQEGRQPPRPSPD